MTDFLVGADGRLVSGVFLATYVVAHRPSLGQVQIDQRRAGHVVYRLCPGPGFDAVASGFASNGYADHSPGGYSLAAAFLAEVLLTFFFLVVILGSTHAKAPAGFAPIAIGLCLTLIHLISIPVTNTSVNPARSTGPALFVGGWALAQLWLFWVAPIAGACAAGAAQRFFESA